MNSREKDYDKIINFIEETKSDLIDFLRQLIMIPTETDPPSGHEKEGQVFVEKKLREMGLLTDVFEPTEVAGITNRKEWCPGYDFSNRPNVVGVQKGSGGGKSLIFNGHMDVVPAGDEGKWTDHPYGAQIREGKIFGRGSADMKAGIAGMIYALKSISVSGYKPKGDVIIESVVNEEGGGYNGTLACCVKGYEANAAIVTEPTQLRINPATKGAQAYRISVPGKGAHVSLWWKGVSALENAIKIKDAIKRFENIRNKECSENIFYGNREIFPTPVRYDNIFSFSSGNTRSFSVPNEATFNFIIEECPGEDFDEILERFEKYLRQACSSDQFLSENEPIIERASRALYPSQIDANHPIIGAVSNAAKYCVGKKPIVCGFESECDAMIFNLYSHTPCIIFGPGNLEVCHAPNEYVPIDELVQFTKVAAITIMDYCGYIMQ